MRYSFILFALAAFASCSPSKKTTISGVLTNVIAELPVYARGESEPKMKTDTVDYIYLVDRGAFDYWDGNHIIDSCIIKEDGHFEFSMDKLPSSVLGLTLYGQTPARYEIIQQPQVYYYNTCLKFFISEPLLYINEGEHAEIEWTRTGDLAEFEVKSPNPERQKILYQMYRTHSDRYAGPDLKIEKASFDVIYERIPEKRKELLDKIDLAKIKDIESFENYYYTEVVLNDANELLSFIERSVPETKTDQLINDPEFVSTYHQVFKDFTKHTWHPSSIEYAQFIERFVNYQVSKVNKKFIRYADFDQQKQKIAQQTLPVIDYQRYEGILSKKMTNNP